MHFEWQLTVGQIVVGMPLMYIMYSLWRISQMLMSFRIEHELLMIDWASRQTPPVQLRDLPTRRNKWW